MINFKNMSQEGCFIIHQFVSIIIKTRAHGECIPLPSYILISKEEILFFIYLFYFIYLFFFGGGGVGGGGGGGIKTVIQITPKI